MTLTSTWTTLAHHGMIIVPLGYGAPELFEISEVRGGGPYGASHVSGSSASQDLSAVEQELAYALGRRLADVADGEPGNDGTVFESELGERAGCGRLSSHGALELRRMERESACEGARQTAFRARARGVSAARCCSGDTKKASPQREGSAARRTRHRQGSGSRKMTPGTEGRQVGWGSARQRKHANAGSTARRFHEHSARKLPRTPSGIKVAAARAAATSLLSASFHTCRGASFGSCAWEWGDTRAACPPLSRSWLYTCTVPAPVLRACPHHRFHPVAPSATNAPTGRASSPRSP